MKPKKPEYWIEPRGGAGWPMWVICNSKTVVAVSNIIFKNYQERDEHMNVISLVTGLEVRKNK